MNNKVLEVIKSRRSSRSFKVEQIKDDELNVVIEAAKYAPNGGNQAWHFTIVQNKNLLEKINVLAKEAGSHMDGFIKSLATNEKYNVMYNAPTLVFVSSDEKSNACNDDCAAATENMLIAAESIDLGACWLFFPILSLMSSKGEELRKELQLPEGYRVCTTVALGYKAAATANNKKIKENIVTVIK